jgi:hypothetical protein
MLNLSHLMHKVRSAGGQQKRFHPPLNANCIFLQVFFKKNLTLCMTKLRGIGAVFS